MSGTHRTCVICGFKEKRSNEQRFFARFPLDKQRCVEWLKVVGIEELAYLPIEKLYDLRHVCEIHFQKRDFTKSGTRLKKRAVPKLHLASEAILNDDAIADFLRLNSHVDAPTVTRPSEGLNTDAVNYPLAVASTSGAVGSTPSLAHIAQEKRKMVVKAPVPMEPSPEQPSKKRPLATSVGINVNDPIPTSQSTDSETEQKRIKLTKADLEGRELQLYSQLIKLKSSIKSLKKSAQLIESIESPTLKEIVIMALKNQKRKPRGRRWTTKYKISLLAIFKRSPKAYRYLKYLMPLPSVVTVTNILKKLPMEPGISHHVMEHLKKHCPKNAQDKVCSLLFDEIAIKPRLLYNSASDKIEGFTDLGNGERSSELADHALVFMLQGLKKKFKQPVAFYFVKGTISSQKLASLIKEIIECITLTGFNIMATICDQGPTNMGAIKMLCQHSAPMENNANNNCFTVNGKKVYIIYDVPHLFKSIRNNFLNYGAIRIDGKTAKWEHLFKVEEMNRDLLYLSKISQIHVQPKYRAKMKVKYAAQILSNTVAAVLKLISLAEQDPVAASEIMDTALIIQELDRLFDYTNGPSGPDDVKRGQRQNVSENTNHIQVWTELRKKIETITFEKLATGVKAKNVRCLKGFSVTLCSLRDIWAECKILKFKYLNLRQLNQDALENLFGVIRQHAPTNRNPTVASFIAAIKTAIISKLTAPHSRGANCLKDTNTLLVDFHDTLFSENESENENENEKENINVVLSGQENSDNRAESFPVLNIPEILEDEEEQIDSIINLDKQPVAYLSGYIAYRLRKKQNCDLCLKTLTIDPEDASSNLFLYIKLREWWKDKNSLTYPSNNLYTFVESCVHTFETELLQTMHILNIRLTAVTLFLANSQNNSTLGCSKHHQMVIDFIMAELASLLIRRQCNRINKKISIDEENLADQVKKKEQRGVH